MTVDETASAPDSFLDVNFCTSSAGDRGIVVGGLGLRKRGIVMRVDGKIKSTTTKSGGVYEGAWGCIRVRRSGLKLPS